MKIINKNEASKIIDYNLHVCLKPELREQLINKANYMLPIKDKILIKNNETINKKIFNTFIDIVGNLQKENINYFLFKGPILSKLIYGTYTYRSYDDFDIYIVPKNYLHFAEYMESRNFVCINTYAFDNINIKYLERVLLSSGDCHFTNNCDICFEAKTNIFNLTKNQLNELLSHKLFIKINNYNLASLDLIGNIIILLLYLNYSLNTIDGVMHKNYLNYLFELIELIEANEKCIDYEIVKNELNKIKLEKVLNKINEMTYVIFGIKFFDNNCLISGKFDLNYEKYQLLDSKFKHIKFLTYFLKYNKNKVLKNKIKCNYINNSDYFYVSLFKFENDACFILLEYPKFLDFITFSIEIICENGIDSIELSFYERDIYEFRTSTNIKYIFRYYTENCRKIEITLNTMPRPIAYRILIKKIGKHEKIYPIMENPYKDFLRI